MSKMVMAILIMIVVHKSVHLGIAETSATEMPALQAPPCISTKLVSCVKQINYTKMAESIISNPNQIQYPCCFEWGQEFRENKQCVCNYVGSYLNSMTAFHNKCNITSSPHTMCQGINKTENSDANGGANNSFSAGLFPIMLFILTIILKV